MAGFASLGAHEYEQARDAALPVDVDDFFGGLALLKEAHAETMKALDQQKRLVKTAMIKELSLLMSVNFNDVGPAYALWNETVESTLYADSKDVRDRADQIKYVLETQKQAYSDLVEARLKAMQYPSDNELIEKEKIMQNAFDEVVDAARAFLGGIEIAWERLTKEVYMRFLRIASPPAVVCNITTDFNGYNDVERLGYTESTLKVNFSVLKRSYYFFLCPVNGVPYVFISGDATLSNSVIYGILRANVLHIENFYYVLKPSAKEHIKSDTFKGYGPRGMFLIKYIAKVLGVDSVTLKDAWKQGDINSTNLKRMLKRGSKQKSIANWVQFFREKNTYDNAMEEGYYGGFGFKKNSSGNHEAQVDAIQCSAHFN